MTSAPLVLNPVNRRVGTRMYGGVGGRSREAPPIPILIGLSDTRSQMRRLPFVGGFRGGDRLRSCDDVPQSGAALIRPFA